MQTTLLSLGIAIIAALLAALIGPLFIDWGQYRGTIETEASRVIGFPVRIAGSIDVRLLPTPMLDLGAVEIRPGGSVTPLTARKLSMEFGLSTLMRGQFRANELTIDGPDVTIALDRVGTIVMPDSGLGFDPDRLAIDRLTVENGHIVLDDAASGARLAIDNVKFSGDVRSLLGPFKGEGAFKVDAQPYAYRLSASRRGPDGGMKLRLGVDPIARALSFESDGTIWVDGGSPRYEGAVTLSRVVGIATPGGQVAINDPWQMTGKLKATTTSALVEQLDVAYGSEVRAVHFVGTAIMQFGHKPRVASVLTARQVDLDRALGTTDHKRLPFEAIKALAERFAAGEAPPLPIRLSLGIDSLTMGGGVLQSVRGEIENSAEGWTIDTLELRAPGGTQTRISGKLALADRKMAFDGPVKVDSSDPTALFAWVEGRTAAGRPAIAPMRGSGQLTLSAERIGFERLSAEVDRKPLEGRLVYRFADGGSPARLDAALSAPDLDIDRGIAVGAAMLASTSFDRPGEIGLAFDLGHATYAGIEATKARAVLAFDNSGLKIEQLSIADIGGASLDASGRIDNAAQAARGAITMSLAAPRLDGITALAAKFLPQAADTLRKYGAQLVPLRLNAKLDVEPKPDGGASPRTAARLKLDGKMAGIDVTLNASGAGDIADPAAASLRIDGRLDAPDARMLATLTGLDQLVAVDRRSAHLTFQVDGAANGSLLVDAKFAGADTSASAVGTLKASGDGALTVSLHAADARLPRRGAAATVPVDLRGRLAIDGTMLDVMDLSGKVAGSSLTGRLWLNRVQPLRVNGRLDADQVDAAEIVALLAGAPSVRGGGWEWSPDPFAPAGLPALDGSVVFRAMTAQWGGGLVSHDLSGTARFTTSGFSLNDVTGTMADGRLAGDLQIRREPVGLALQSHVKLTNADLPVLLGSTLRVPAVGRFSFDVEAQGQGLSPASLVGAIKGTGTVSLERVEIAGLDPSGLDAAIGAVDRGGPISAGRIGDLVNAGLDAGKLRLPFATAPLVIADGRLQLINVAAPAQNADVAASLAFGLDDGLVDIRIGLTGAQRKNAPSGERPAMVVTVKGPLGAARRTADVTPLVNWLTVRSVEQEAKRLDDAEKEHKRLEAAAEALRHQQDATASAVPKMPPEAAPSAPSPQTSALGRPSDLPPPLDVKPSAPPKPRPMAVPQRPMPLNLMENVPTGGR